MEKSILALVLLSSLPASADVSYVVRASEGIILSEFSSDPQSCGPEIREEIRRAVSNNPVFTIRKTDVLFTTIDRRDSRAKWSAIGKNVTGYWKFGSREFRVTLNRWGNGDHGAKTLDLEISKLSDSGSFVCHEVWSGIVSPSVTREVVLSGR